MVKNTMSQTWEDNWEIVEQADQRQGGQGTVVRVRCKSDGMFGALKQLHSYHLRNKERRYRMQQEVNLLRLLGGIGTPIVIEANTEHWEEVGLPLYVVMDWIEGPTITEYIRNHAFSIGEAILVTNGLLSTIEACNRVGIYHRDLKPDNVVLKHGKLREPIILDFGMAWSHPHDEETLEFETETGQELGNRFLRLPEYAPGKHIRDQRSDLTMLVGMLFFMVTGFAPRVLTDANGKMPHESLATRFPEHLHSDLRWPKLRRVFNIGFQIRLDLRFQSPEQLRVAIDKIETSLGETDVLTAEIERLHEILESDTGRHLSIVQERLRKATQIFLDTFSSHASKAGLSAGGSWGVGDFGREASGTFFILKSGTSTPQVNFSFSMKCDREGTLFKAIYAVEGQVAVEYYTGSSADPESLEEAAEKEAPRILAQLIRIYSGKLRASIER